MGADHVGLYFCRDDYHCYHFLLGEEYASQT